MITPLGNYRALGFLSQKSCTSAIGKLVQLNKEVALGLMIALAILGIGRCDPNWVVYRQ